jgi:hypothetical protein
VDAGGQLIGGCLHLWDVFSLFKVSKKKLMSLPSCGDLRNIIIQLILFVFVYKKIKNMGSSKRKSTGDENGDTTINENELSHSDKLKYVNKIAKPMAGKKLTKKLLKLVKKGKLILPTCVIAFYRYFCTYF